MKLQPISPHYLTFLSDESGLQGQGQEILFPETTEELAQAIKSASAPITIQGARTGMEGGAVPMGGNIINLTHMNHMDMIVRDEDGGSVHVQAGVTLEEIQKQSRAQGLMFPPDPTEQTATVGGLFASGCAGPSVLGYGSASQYVQSLEWITLDGEIWNITRGEYKSSNHEMQLPNQKKIIPPEGCDDLIDFLFGSEGYYGVAASMELKLLKVPQDIWGVMFFFPSEETCIQFSQKIRKTEWEKCRITCAEYYDAGTLQLLKQHKNHALLSRIPEFPVGSNVALYTELAGDDEESVPQCLMDLLDYFADLGGQEEDTWAENGLAALEKFHGMRHSVPSILGEMPEIRSTLGSRYEADISGRSEQFPESLYYFREQLSRYQINGVIYGHMLTNCFHLVLMPEKGQSCEGILQNMDLEIVQLGMQPVSEYGIGKLKAKCFGNSLSPEERNRIAHNRSVLDPNGLMTL